MVWVLLVVGTILVVECFVRSPLPASARQLGNLVRKITGVLKSSSISDHWKEKVLPVYAGKLFLNSILLFFWVVVALLPMVVIGLLASAGGVPMIELLSSLTGILASTLVAVAYIFLTNRVRKT